MSGDVVQVVVGPEADTLAEDIEDLLEVSGVGSVQAGDLLFEA